MAGGGKFNPAALMSLSASLGEDAEIVTASEGELLKLAGPDTRRKLAGMKLAARIVGMAVAGRDDIDEGQLLHQMQAVMTRLGTVRQKALDAVGIDRASPDYAVSFNVATNVAMDILTEEWKWSKLDLEAAPLSGEGLRNLLALSLGDGGDEAGRDGGADLATVRRLCVLEAMPKLWNVTNMFDYYHPKREKLVGVLARAVVAQAEHQASRLYSKTTPAFAVRDVVQRSYGVSTGLMCEVYKDAAARDVTRLRALPELDRAVVLAQHESYGMPFEHILQRHEDVMKRALETTELIIEAQAGPAKVTEQNYDA